MLKSNIKDVEKSVDEIWATIEDMKEATKALKDSKTIQEEEMQELRALLTKTKAVLVLLSEACSEFPQLSELSAIFLYESFTYQSPHDFGKRGNL